MKATFNPGTPEVTQTVVVASAVEATVTRTVSLEECAKLRALVGQTKYGCAEGCFDVLEDLMEVHAIPRLRITQEHGLPALTFTKA